MVFGRVRYFGVGPVLAHVRCACSLFLSVLCVRVILLYSWLSVFVLCALLVVLVIGYCPCSLYKVLFFVIAMARVRCSRSLFLFVL